MEPNPGKNPDFLYDYHLVMLKSGYSNQVSLWESNKGQKLVMRRPAEMPYIDIETIALTPFLNPNKLNKEFELLKFLETQGIPIAKCVYHESSSLSIYEYAEGEELDFQNCAKRPIEERIQIGINLGKFLGKFHKSQQGDMGRALLAQIPGKFDHNKPKDKHLWRLEASIAYLEERGVINEKDAIDMRTLGYKELIEIPDTQFYIIHGDFYSRNIFIDQNSLIITAVIDWIDASEVDDPFADLLLTARWYSFNDEFTDAEVLTNKDAFYSVIQGYYDETGIVFNRDPIQLYKFYDLLWHLRVIIAEQARGNDQTVKQFKNTLYSLVDQMR